MSIWFKQPTVEELNRLLATNMLAHVGIEYTAIDESGLEARMPVDHRTQQPYGILHGGASVVLAESVGSAAANLCVDHAKYHCVGLSVSSNHVSSVREGTVLGRAEPLHLGRSTQVWRVSVTSGERLVSTHSLTMKVLTL